MRGLIIKDIYNLKKNLKTTLIIILFYAFLSYNTGDVSMLIGLTTFIMVSMSITSLAYDDMAKWDGYALSMPVTRKSIVLGKYVLALILSVLSIVVSSILAIIISYIRGDLDNIFRIQEILLIIYTVFLVCMFYISIIMPLVFNFGVENSRLLMIGSMAIPVGIGYLLVKMGVQLPTEDQLTSILYISPIILILVLIISFSIALSIYKKKDI